MEIYIILFWYEFFLGLLVQKKIEKGNILYELSDGKLKINIKMFIFFILMLVPLWLVMGMRYGIGTDFYQYKNMFTVINQKKRLVYSNSEVEIGFQIFNYIIGFFTDNSQWMFLFSSLIIVLGYLKGFFDNKNSIVIAMSAFMGLGYYFYSMNLLRQYMAIAITFYGVTYLEKGKIRKFFLFLLIAALFHKSILIWLPVVFIIKIIPGKKFYYATFIFGFCLFLGNNLIKQFLIKYTKYGAFFRNNNNFVQSKMSYTNILIAGMILILAFLFRKKIIEINRVNDMRIKCIWIMIISYIFLSFFGDATIRLILSFSFYGLLILADVVSCINKKYRYLANICFAIVMFYFMVIIINYPGNVMNRFVPYVSGTL